MKTFEQLMVEDKDRFQLFIRTLFDREIDQQKSETQPTTVTLLDVFAEAFLPDRSD